MAETPSCNLNKAEPDSVLDLGLVLARQQELSIRAFVAKLLLLLLLLLLLVLVLVLVDIPFWLLPVGARVLTLVAKNRARGFVLPGLAHHPRHHRCTKVWVWSIAPSQCSPQVEKYIRGRIMWPPWLASSRFAG